MAHAPPLLPPAADWGGQERTANQLAWWRGTAAQPRQQHNGTRPPPASSSRREIGLRRGEGGAGERGVDDHARPPPREGGEKRNDASMARERRERGSTTTRSEPSVRRWRSAAHDGVASRGAIDDGPPHHGGSYEAENEGVEVMRAKKGIREEARARADSPRDMSVDDIPTVQLHHVRHPHCDDAHVASAALPSHQHLGKSELKSRAMDAEGPGRVLDDSGTKGSILVPPAADWHRPRTDQELAWWRGTARTTSREDSATRTERGAEAKLNGTERRSPLPGREAGKRIRSEEQQQERSSQRGEFSGVAPQMYSIDEQGSHTPASGFPIDDYGHGADSGARQNWPSPANGAPRRRNGHSNRPQGKSIGMLPPAADWTSKRTSNELAWWRGVPSNSDSPPAPAHRSSKQRITDPRNDSSFLNRTSSRSSARLASESQSEYNIQRINARHGSERTPPPQNWRAPDSNNFACNIERDSPEAREDFQPNEWQQRKEEGSTYHREIPDHAGREMPGSYRRSRHHDLEEVTTDGSQRPANMPSYSPYLFTRYPHHQDTEEVEWTQFTLSKRGGFAQRTVDPAEPMEHPLLEETGVLVGTDMRTASERLWTQWEAVLSGNAHSLSRPQPYGHRSRSTASDVFASRFYDKHHRLRLHPKREWRCQFCMHSNARFLSYCDVCHFSKPLSLAHRNRLTVSLRPSVSDAYDRQASDDKRQMRKAKRLGPRLNPLERSQTAAFLRLRLKEMRAELAHLKRQGHNFNLVCQRHHSPGSDFTLISDDPTLENALEVDSQDDVNDQEDHHNDDDLDEEDDMEETEQDMELRARIEKDALEKERQINRRLWAAEKTKELERRSQIERSEARRKRHEAIEEHEKSDTYGKVRGPEENENAHEQGTDIMDEKGERAPTTREQREDNRGKQSKIRDEDRERRRSDDRINERREQEARKRREEENALRMEEERQWEKERAERLEESRKRREEERAQRLEEERQRERERLQRREEQRRIEEEERQRRKQEEKQRLEMERQQESERAERREEQRREEEERQKRKQEEKQRERERTVQEERRRRAEEEEKRSNSDTERTKNKREKRRQSYNDKEGTSPTRNDSHSDEDDQTEKVKRRAKKEIRIRRKALVQTEADEKKKKRRRKKSAAPANPEKDSNRMSSENEVETETEAETETETETEAETETEQETETEKNEPKQALSNQDNGAAATKKQPKETGFRIADIELPDSPTNLVSSSSSDAPKSKNLRNKLKERIQNRADTLVFVGKDTFFAKNIDKVPFPELPSDFQVNDRQRREEKEQQIPKPAITDFTLPSTYDESWYRSHLSLVVRAQSVLRGRLARRRYSKQKERAKIAYEILTTEKSYLEALSHLYECRKKLEEDSKVKVKSDKIKVIWQEPLKDMVELARIICARLESKVGPGRWHAYREISDVFLDLGPRFSVYVPYIIHYNEALEALHDLNKTNKRFKQFSEESSRTFKFLDFEAILIMPIQRIPRYILLLKALIKVTHRTHPDYDQLNKALDLVSTIATDINSSVKKYENHLTVCKIDSLLVPRIKDFAQPNREFVGSGMVIMYDDKKKLRRNKQKVRTVFLFSDVFLLTKHIPSSGVYHLKFVIYLNPSVHIEHNPYVPDVGNEHVDCVFRLHSERANQSITLMTRTMDEKISWLIALEQTLFLIQDKINEGA